jgi:hypothetical protein
MRARAASAKKIHQPSNDIPNYCCAMHRCARAVHIEGEKFGFSQFNPSNKKSM